MNRAECLKTAGDAVIARGTRYGTPEDNFERIARRWSSHLINAGIIAPGQSLSAHNVAIMMCDLKLARLENDETHEDSWVDIAGYAACGAEITTERNNGNNLSA
jgi:Domain of unknown function (DUF6378)